MAELLRYRFTHDPENETPMFFMFGGGLPNRLQILHDSGILEDNHAERRYDFIYTMEILSVMVEQAAYDREPGTRGGYQKDQDGEGEFRITNEDIWTGTAKRVCEDFRRSHLKRVWNLEEQAEKPLPEHSHEQGPCNQDDIEGLCSIWSREDELERRRELEQDTEDRKILQDPEYVQARIEFLEKYGVLERMSDSTPLKDTLNGSLRGVEGEGKGLTDPLQVSSPLIPSNVKGSLKRSKGRNGKSGNHFLTLKAKAALEVGGIDPDLIRFFDNWNGYAKALNNANPLRGGAVGLVGFWKAKRNLDEIYEGWIQQNPSSKTQEQIIDIQETDAIE